MTTDLTAAKPTTVADDWLMVTEALEAAGWVGDEDNPLEVLRKDGACWAVRNDCYDSQLGAGSWDVGFPSDTPVLVVIAACLAAVGDTTAPAMSEESR